MAMLIPEEWKRKVCGALDSDDDKRCVIRQRALLDWAATFPLAFAYEQRVALSEALRQPEIMGERKVMDEPAETYAFFFTHERVKMYGKVGLMPDGSVVIIYSSHRPDPSKGERL
jgi:proteasome lid subunit RPN8/RPN11